MLALMHLIFRVYLENRFLGHENENVYFKNDTIQNTHSRDSGKWWTLWKLHGKLSKNQLHKEISFYIFFPLNIEHKFILVIFKSKKRSLKLWVSWKSFILSHKIVMEFLIVHIWHIPKKNVILIMFYKFVKYDLCKRWRTVQRMKKHIFSISDGCFWEKKNRFCFSFGNKSKFDQNIQAKYAFIIFIECWKLLL